MRYLITIIMAIIVVVLQLAVAPHLQVFDVVPHFVLITSLLWLTHRTLRFAAGWSVACALALDLYDAHPFGLTPLLLLATLLICQLLRQRFFPRRSLIGTAILTALGSIILTIFEALSTNLQFHSFTGTIVVDTLLIAFGGAIINGVLALLFYSSAKKGSGMLDYLDYRAGKTTHE